MAPLVKFGTRHPLFRLLCALIGGILISDCARFDLLWSLAIMGAALVLALFTIRRSGFGVAAFLFFFGVGALQSTLQWRDMCLPVRSDRVEYWQAELLDYPEETLRAYRMPLRVMRYACDDSLYACSFRLLAYMPKDDNVKTFLPGTRLQFETMLQSTELLAGTSAYSRYLYHQGIGATAYFSGYIRLTERAKPSWKSTTLRFRRTMLERLDDESMSDATRAFLHAVLLGDKVLLDREMKARFSAAGVSHLLAISGLHLGILIAIVSGGLSVLCRKPRCKRYYSLLVCGLAWGYAGLSGWSPSVIRATAMFTLYTVSMLLGRRGKLLHILFLSAFIMIYLHPAYLYSVSFQLSYVALLSIVCYHSVFRRLAPSWVERYRPLRYLWDVLCVSVSAQLGSFPLVLYYFHSFPLYFVWSNLWLVPVSFVLLMLAVFYFLSWFSPFLQALWANPLVALAQMMVSSVDFFSSLPFACLKISLNIGELLLLYLVLATFSYGIIAGCRKGLLWSWFLLLCFLAL